MHHHPQRFQGPILFVLQAPLKEVQGLLNGLTGPGSFTGSIADERFKAGLACLAIGTVAKRLDLLDLFREPAQNLQVVLKSNLIQILWINELCA